jgi:hypothetical protein
LTTLASDTAYHSFAGEVEARRPPRYAAFFPSGRHQLSRISLVCTGSYVLEYGVVYATVFVAPSLPQEDPVMRGFRDRGRVALDDSGAGGATGGVPFTQTALSK